MVRAHAVDHPSEWYGGAFLEHSGTRQRYRVIDRDRLFNCLACPEPERFQLWYQRTLQHERDTRRHAREALWTDAAAVGSRRWIEGLGLRLPTASLEVTPADPFDHGVAEAHETYVLRISNRQREGLLTAIPH